MQSHALQVAAMDTDGDGTVSFVEFNRWWWDGGGRLSSSAKTKQAEATRRSPIKPAAPPEDQDDGRWVAEQWVDLCYPVGDIWAPALEMHGGGGAGGGAASAGRVHVRVAWEAPAGVG